MPDPAPKPDLERTLERTFRAAYGDLAQSRSRRPTPMDVREMDLSSGEFDVVEPADEPPEDVSAD